MHQHGYFGPGSATWKITSEAILTLAGARAVLLQLAHPLVALGVSTHSSYMSDPLGRAERTFLLGQMLTFGTNTTAHTAARTINRLHQHVQGVLPLEAGAHTHGTFYDAQDPSLLLWVHATLIDTILLVYPMFVGPLSPDEQETYYQESKIIARLLGLGEKDMPETVADLRRYVHDMAYSNVLAATPQARTLAHRVLFPPVPEVFHPLMHLHREITSALLPQPVREMYGMNWGPKRQFAFAVGTAALRQIVPRLPLELRVFPITRSMMHNGAAPSSGYFNNMGFTRH